MSKYTTDSSNLQQDTENNLIPSFIKILIGRGE